MVLNRCLRDSSKKEGNESSEFGRTRKGRLVAQLIRRYDRRRNRALFIRAQYRTYYGRYPGVGSRPWWFYDAWSAQRLCMSYEAAYALEEEALLLLQRVTQALTNLTF